MAGVATGPPPDGRAQAWALLRRAAWLGDAVKPVLGLFSLYLAEHRCYHKSSYLRYRVCSRNGDDVSVVLVTQGALEISNEELIGDPNNNICFISVEDIFFLSGLFLCSFVYYLFVE